MNTEQMTMGELKDAFLNVINEQEGINMESKRYAELDEMYFDIDDAMSGRFYEVRRYGDTDYDDGYKDQIFPATDYPAKHIHDWIKENMNEDVDEWDLIDWMEEAKIGSVFTLDGGEILTTYIQ